MKTPEEILFERNYRHFFDNSGDEVYYITAVDARLAMEEYADQFKSKWICTNSHLPYVNKEVLLLGRDKKVYIGYFTINTNNEKFWKTDIYYPFHKVTHWQPLPESPIN